MPEQSACLDWAWEIASLKVSDQREQIKKLLINSITPESHCPFAIPTVLVGRRSRKAQRGPNGEGCCTPWSTERQGQMIRDTGQMYPTADAWAHARQALLTL